MGITIPKNEGQMRSRKDERKNPTNPRGKRTVGTVRKKKKKSTGGEPSKNALRPGQQRWKLIDGPDDSRGGGSTTKRHIRRKHEGEAHPSPSIY